MYLNIMKNKKTGRTSLSICRGFRDSTGKVKHTTVKTLGLLEDLKKGHELVITLEDGVLDGGFGEKITRFYGNSSMKVLNYGSLKEFTDRASMEELNIRYRLKPELIVEDIKNIM